MTAFTFSLPISTSSRLAVNEQKSCFRFQGRSGPVYPQTTHTSECLMQKYVPTALKKRDGLFNQKWVMILEMSEVYGIDRLPYKNMSKISGYRSRFSLNVTKKRKIMFEFICYTHA